MPMNTKLTTILGSLAALSPTNDIRYYINGVLIEHDKEGKHLVVTNGHYMVFATLRGELAECVDIPKDTRVILPIAQLKSMLKAVGKGATSITVSEDAVTLHQETGLDGTLKGVEGRFPDWRRVNNPIEKAEFTALNADYLIKLMREFKKHTTRKLGYGVKVETTNALHASRFTVEANDYTITALLMGVRL